MGLGLVFVMGVVAGCGDPQIVVPQVLSVVTILPSQGSTDITPTVEGLIYFSHPLASPETLADHVSLNCLGAPPCSQPDATSCATQAAQVTLSYDSTAFVVHVLPQAPLAASTCYQYVVGAGLTSSEKNVAPLPGEVDSSFQTR